MDSIEDLASESSKHVDSSNYQRSEASLHRLAKRRRRKRPNFNKNRNRNVGPSAFSYHTSNDQHLPSLVHHEPPRSLSSLRTHDSERPLTYRPKKSISSSSAVIPFNNQHHRPALAKQVHQSQPPSAYSSSAAASPFKNFVKNHNSVSGIQLSIPLRERPKPTPHEINPFNEHQPIHDYSFGPLLENQYDQRRPISNERRPPAPVQHQFHNKQRDKLFPFFPPHDEVRELHDRPIHTDGRFQPHSSRPPQHQVAGFLNSGHDYRSSLFQKNSRPHQPSLQHDRRPPEHYAPQNNDDIVLDYPSPQPPERVTEPNVEIQSSHGHKFHEELDYPLIYDEYEYVDDYVYEDRPPNHRQKVTPRPSHYYRPEKSSEKVSNERFKSTNRPLQHKPVEYEEQKLTIPNIRNRTPIHSSKFIKTDPPIRDRTPIRRPLEPDTTSQQKKQSNYRGTTTERYRTTTQKPQRPTRPKIHIPIRPRRTTTTSTTPAPKTTLKPFTMPPYERPSLVNRFRKKPQPKRPIHIPGTAKHPELSKLSSSSSSSTRTTDARLTDTRHRTRYLEV